MESNLDIITTGVEEEVREFLWKVKNFKSLQQDRLSVDKQKIEITVGKENTQSKWQIGLRSGVDECDVVFKLVEITGEDTSLSAKINWEIVDRDNSPTDTSKDIEQVIDEDEEVVMDDCFELDDDPDWEPYLDENGSLTMRIKITVLYKTEDRNFQCEPTSAMESFKKEAVAELQGNLAKLMANTANADVKIVCSDGKELTAHRNILSANSVVFESMLSPESEFAESQNGIIEVDDISSKTMEIVLTYIYTGELKPTWCHPDTIVEFTYAAGKYQLTEVLKMLDSVLGQGNNSVCNIMLLNLAQKLHLKMAETQLMKRIVKLTTAAKSSEDLFAIFGNTEVKTETAPVQRTLPSS